jgi:hypothetical protein
MLAQCAQGVTEVAPERFQPGQSAPLAIGLPGLLHAAKANERLPPRFLGTQAGADAVFGMQTDMAL